MDTSTREKLVLIYGDDDSFDSLGEFLTIESLPKRSYYRHKCLEPKKVTEILTPRRTSPLRDDDVESFYSLSDNENEDDDVELGIVDLNLGSSKKQQDLKPELYTCFSKSRSIFRQIFQCMFCKHRRKLSFHKMDDPRSL